MAASWECPSLPMIHLPMKDSSKVTFLAVKPMIAAHYEEDPESFRDEIRQLDQLRELALRPSRDYNGCSVLRRYFAQLHLLRARFPPETIGQLPIDFVWKDVYTNAEYVQEGLQIEQASVLYNICCLHSILASRGRRDTEQEMKEAITHFQCAAGAYAYLDERFATSHASKDLGPEFVAFYKNLMLGQAQECFVEKSLKGVGRVKNNTVAKLAARVSEYYTQCLRPLETEPCNIIAKKNKDWPKLLKMKTLYFQAISHFYQGAHSEEVGKHGEAIAWYQFSLQKLHAIGRVPKSLGEAARDAVKNFNSHVQDKLQTVKRQNDQVYHDSIPDVELLEPTQGADLVKPVAFHATDPKNLGTDIFGRLVPMGAYEAASVFSEEKAKLLRSVVSSVAEKDEELEQYLVSLNPDEIKMLKQDAPKIPESVLEQHKLMQGKSMLVKKLHSDLQNLMELSSKVDQDLADIDEKKKEEVEGEEKFQAKLGARTPSQVCAALWKDAKNYHTYHGQASKSNKELKTMFHQHYQYLVLLSGPLASLQATVPKMTPMDAPEEDGSDTERWEELMGKIEKMRQQRRMLIGQLREQINSDDITKTMVGHLGSDKEVFISDHMKRHRELADIIRQNLAAQENILLAVTDVNARQVRVRQAAQDLLEQRERLFTALTKAGGFFSVLQSKIGEGLSFYTRLHDNISKLHKRVLEVVATRQREREAAYRQRSPSPSPGPAPPRPPKKAELVGKPLPPDQQAMLPEQPESAPNVLTQQEKAAVVVPPPVSIAMTSVPPQPSAASLEDQLRELQRTQQLQMQQLTSPSSQLASGVTEDGTTNQPQTSLSAAPTNQEANVTDTVNSEMLPPDANQALLDLQLLLQPPGEEVAGLSEPIQPERFKQSDHIQLPLTAEQQPTLQGQQGPPPAQIPMPSPQGPPLAQIPMPSQQGPLPGPIPMPSLQDPPLGQIPMPSPQGPPPGQVLMPSPQSPPSGLIPMPGQQGPPPGQIPMPGQQGPPSGQPSIEQATPQLPPPERPAKPVHLQSQTVSALADNVSLQPAGEGHQPQAIDNSSKTSRLLMGNLERTVHQDGQGEAQPLAVVLGEGRHTPVLPPTDPMVRFGAGQQTPLRETQLPLEGEHDSILGEQLPIEGEYGPSVVRQLSTVGVQQQLDSLIDLNIGITQPSNQPLMPSSSPPGGVAGSADSTMTTNSISRPIPAPVQSPPPPTSPPPPPATTAPVPPSDTAHIPAASPLSPVAHISTRLPTTVPAPMILAPLPPTAPASLPPMVPTSLPPTATVDALPSTAIDASTLSVSSHEEPTLPGRVETAGFHSLQGQELTHSTTSLSTSNLSHEASSNQPVVQTTIYPLHGDATGIDEPLLPGQPESSFDPSLSSLHRSVTHSLVDVPRPPHSLSTLGTGSLQSSEFTLSHGIDTNLRSISQTAVVSPHTAMVTKLPQLSSETSFAIPLSTSHTHNHDEEKAKLEELLKQRNETIDKKTKEVEEERALIADQKRQLEHHKQQVALLQQQLSQLSAQQQKQEQEKVTVSGQQAVLMQLLQQQQGMFSQQQSQLESLSKVNEEHHKQLQESEMKYRQALTVEQEQKTNLQNQVLQLNQEIQRLHHQIQSQSQQQQAAQMQVYQYHTQIQERDKQLIAFRDQHKEIVQKLEQKHQEKIAQLIQQIQELQMSLKKSREQQRALQSGLPLPLQPTRAARQVQPSPQTPRQQPQPSPQQQQLLPQQPQPLPQQPQRLPQQQQLPQQTQLLPQQPQASPQPQMSQGQMPSSVPSTPTSVQHQQGIIQPSASTQPMSQPHSAHQPLPPTSAGWPMTSGSMSRQSSQAYPSQVPPPQHIQPSNQPMTQSHGMVAPGNRPMLAPTQPGSVPRAPPTGQTTGGFIPPTGAGGMIGYPPQFTSGQQQRPLPPPQPHYQTFAPESQFPSQIPTHQPRH